MKFKSTPIILMILLLIPISAYTSMRVVSSANLESKFEPWLWDKVLEKEVNAPDEYLSLIIRSVSQEVKILLGEQLRSIEGVRRVRVLEALPMVIAEVKASNVRNVATSDLIKHIGDGERKVTTFLDTATETIGGKTTWETYGVNGSGITIAVLDTGIDDTHPDLVDQVDYSISFAYNFTEGQETLEDPQDYRGHGTFVAGIAAGKGIASNGTYKGVAPGAKLVNVKVVNSSGTGEVEWLIKGINWVIANKEVHNIQIVSMSVGVVYGNKKGEPDYGQYDDGTSSVCQAADSAVANGLVVVVAQGNYERFEVGDDPTKYDEYEHAYYIYGKDIYCLRPPASPAAAFNVIAVGASDDKGTVSINDDEMWLHEYEELIRSRAGPTKDNRTKPDVVAPGVGVTSANYKWETQDNYVPGTGTSASTPLVSGAIALLLEMYPYLTPAEVKQALNQTAVLNTDLFGEYSDYVFGSENIRGEGIINVTEAIALYYPSLENPSFEQRATSAPGVYACPPWNASDDGWRELRGDANEDGKCNYQDLYLLSAAYGSEKGDPEYDWRVDFNGDGKVDYQDQSILSSDYGKTATRVDGSYSWYASAGGDYYVWQWLNDTIGLRGQEVTFEFSFYPEAVSQNRCRAEIQYVNESGTFTVNGTWVYFTETNWLKANVTATLPLNVTAAKVIIHGEPDFKAWVDDTSIKIIP